MATQASSTPPEDYADIDALTEWIRHQVPPLLQSGHNWKITIHGGSGGGVRCEIMRIAQILPERKRK